MRGDRDGPDPELVQGVTHNLPAVAAADGTLTVFEAVHSLDEP